MNAKNIIKSIVGLGVMSGVAFLAYKVGKNEGKTNERKRIWGERYDDDYDSFSYDEEDDMCIAPEKDC